MRRSGATGLQHSGGASALGIDQRAEARPSAISSVGLPLHTYVVTKMNELFLSVSRHMTPSQLFTLTGPPSARSERGVRLQTLALYGVLVILVAPPTIASARRRPARSI